LAGRRLFSVDSVSIARELFFQPDQVILLPNRDARKTALRGWPVQCELMRVMMRRPSTVHLSIIFFQSFEKIGYGDHGRQNAAPTVIGGRFLIPDA